MFRSPNSSILGGALRRQIGELASALGINRPLPKRGNVDISGQYLVGGSQITTANLSDVISIATPWTPVDLSGAGLTFTVNNCSYVRIGPLYFVFVDLNYPTTSDTHAAVFGGIPFTTQLPFNFNYSGVVQWNGSGNLYWMFDIASHISFSSNLNLSGVSNATLSGTRLKLSFAAA